MSDVHADEERLIDLEIKMAFMEDMVESLNQVIVQQQRQIDLLVRETTRLQSQLEQGASTPTFRSLRDELPPHY